jgi:hypothetical protein
VVFAALCAAKTYKCNRLLGQAPVRREFPAVVHGQRVPHLIGYGLEGADSGPVQECRPLVRHEFCQKKLGFPVNKSRYTGGFTSAFYPVI